MVLKFIKNTVLLFVIVLLSCGSNTTSNIAQKETYEAPKENLSGSEIIVGANQTEAYLPLLKNKRVGIVANQTSVIFTTKNASTSEDSRCTHLVDSLYALDVAIKKVFAPEHGFRGKADAGELVKDGVDTKTGLPIISLYGKNKKPYPEQLEDLDMVIFDIQDVGARFYTYISTLHYVMEACAEQDIPVLILDRPNPNGHYIDGPILEMPHKSFVGMHPIPVVHGMTIGEYAQMINGQHWLKDGIQCQLSVISMKQYSRDMSYSLPIKPSPNLPNDIAINLYPSLCFFEGTNVSAGRGTDMQFQIYGSPFLDKHTHDFSFTPQANEGAKYPKHQNELCYGENLSTVASLNFLDLQHLIEAYNTTSDQTTFFNTFFTKLAGSKTLQKQIEQGYTAREIRKTWLDDLETFSRMRQPYLIYN
jgi:uncharacterized protein YbbC (DUF1343 family)